MFHSFCLAAMQFESLSLSLLCLQEFNAPAAALHVGAVAKTLQEQWYLFIYPQKYFFSILDKLYYKYNECVNVTC